MEIVNAWFYVDKKGVEYVSNVRPVRKRVKKSGFVKISTCYEDPNTWCHPWQEEEQLIVKFNQIKLPKGTIEKIIGIKICFLNDPVNINLHISKTQHTFVM